ncbi:MAG TPA: DUF6249 domain-containing protein [Blastocatellia bacterium]|nr:DUF6249 domain-containing protein [Blastocatellia bacterium]
MFCPQCGSNQSDELKFCKSCGANLQAVRQVVTTRETGEKFDWNKTWVAEMLLSHEELKRRKQERGITPEVRRYNEIKAGVITSCVGVGVMIFLYVFMQGIVLGGNITPNAAEIISRLWVAGVIPFFVGVGLLINGLFVSKRQVEAAGQEPPTRPVTLEKATDPHSLRTADTADFTPPRFSVTEETTKQLRNPGQKQ